MSLSASSKEKPFDNYLSFLLDSYQDDPMKSIAVLFTDVVGSTKYFKVFGDIDGREMLRRHQNLATPIIYEYKGNLIKVLGDSVMAYFSGPSEALRAAMKMQHIFRAHNADASSEHQIRIRIGVHFGKVIIEEKDIYGDVVNVAAKLTNLAHGDEIYISKEVYELAQDIPGVHFELVNLWDMKDVPSGLTMYKTIWEKAVIAEPVLKTFLHVHPASDHRSIDLSQTWDSLIDDAHFMEAIGKGHEEQYIAPDKSLILVFNDSISAISGAERLLAHLGSRLPVQTTIYKSSHIKGSTPQSENLMTEWDTIIPGEVYISPEAYLDIKEEDGIAVEPLTGEGIARGFYKIQRKYPTADTADETQEPVRPLFDKKILMHGTYTSCFYCGDRKHYPSDCPSKNLPGKTAAFHQLGYLSPGKIGELVFTYLNTNRAPILTSHDNSHGAWAEQAFLAFYELKRVFQLPFFRIIWNNPGTRWEKVKESTSQNEGGIVWLAQDSIRVSDHSRAKTLLKDVLEKFPDDYKVYCLMGYLHIEKNDLNEARKDFEKAFSRAKTNPQKIFILFQLARIHTLLGDAQSAQDKISNILFIDPGCNEAIYQDILWKLKQKQEKAAMQYLVNLIIENGDYYVVALIDPDMEPYKAVIEQHLGTMLKNARENAYSRYRDAKGTLQDTRELLSPKGLSDTDSMQARINELMQSDSYFGYLDAVRYSDFIVKVCEIALKEQKRDISDTVDQLSQRLERLSRFVKEYRYRQLVDSYYKRIMLLRIKVNDLKGADRLNAPWQFDACHTLCGEISAELDSLEPKLEGLELVQQILYTFFNFLKYCSVFLSIVFFIGIFVFPFFVDPMNVILTKLEFTSISNAWSFQKTFLVMGGVASFIVSFFISIKKLFKNDMGIPSL